VEADYGILIRVVWTPTAVDTNGFAVLHTALATILVNGIVTILA
jgi:hypothetical protein